MTAEHRFKPVIVTFQHPEDARAAGRELLEMTSVGDSFGVQVHTAPFPRDRVTLRQTRARTWGLVGALFLGATLAILGAVAGLSGGIGVSPLIGALVGMLLGAAYGAIVGALAGSTELSPRLHRLASALRRGRSAVIARLPPKVADGAEETLLRQPGAVRAL